MCLAIEVAAAQRRRAYRRKHERKRIDRERERKRAFSAKTGGYIYRADAAQWQQPVERRGEKGREARRERDREKVYR